MLSTCMPIVRRFHQSFPPQTSSAGLSSFRILRCQQCRPLSKYQGTVTSFWQQVGPVVFLLNCIKDDGDSFRTEEATWLASNLFFILGTYKPRIRCYDTYQLSLKFERCLDSDGTSEKCFLFYISQERVCEPFWITWISALTCEKMCPDLHRGHDNRQTQWRCFIEQHVNVVVAVT